VQALALGGVDAVAQGDGQIEGGGQDSHTRTVRSREVGGKVGGPERASLLWAGGQPGRDAAGKQGEPTRVPPGPRGRS
jgi:hypothetical protein